MKHIVIISLVCLSGVFQELAGQERPIIFSGDFKGVSFSEFARSVEDQTGIAFYYRDSWVREIRVTLSGSGISLFSTLDSILHPLGLFYFLDEWDHLFITGSTRLLSGLPEYNRISDAGDSTSTSLAEEQVTSAEQKYINGRRVLEPETIHVGLDKAVPEGKRVLINGKIEDIESGEPLIGATLYIEQAKKGASTNAEGLFTLIVETGTYETECKSMGMEPLRFRMIVHSGGDLVLSMKRTLIPLEEVVVTANKYQNVSGNQMGFERLNYNVFKEVPLVMGERDILNVVKMLPGVQSVGEGSAGFNVRGSGVDQNMILINNVPVYNSSHLFGFFTSFSPETVADFTLYKSNIPASFGGRLASFFDIRTRQGNMKRFNFRGGISSVSAYAVAEGPIKKDESSFILSARSTYSDWMLRLMEDPLLRNSKAGFYDISAGYTQKLKEGTRIRVFGYLSSDRFMLGKTNAFAYGNAGGSIDLNHRFNQRVTGDFAVVYSRYRFSTSNVERPSTGYKHVYRVNHYELKSDFKWMSLGSHAVTFGANAIYYHLDRGIIEPYGDDSYRKPLDLGMENGVETGAYVADELTLTDHLTAYAGLRLSSFMSFGPSQVRIYTPGMPMMEENITDTIVFGPGEVARTYFGVEPRLNLRYLVGSNSSFKLSYNRSYQYLFMLSNTIALSPTDQWKLCDYHIEPQHLDQVSAGYYRDFPGSGITTSVELYRKWGHHIVEFRDGASFFENPYVENETLPGEQKAYGIETMIRRNAGAVNGWMSYTYSRSLILVDVPGTGEQINNGMPYPSNYDRPHSFNMAVNFKRGRKMSLSTNVVYMTGRPATYPVSVYYEYEVPYIHYSDRNRYRIPDYFRLDVSLNIEGNLKKRKMFHSFWMLSAYNLTGRKNAYSVYFKNVNGFLKGYKLSIFAQPIFTVSWNVKLGNYASE